MLKLAVDQASLELSTCEQRERDRLLREFRRYVDCSLRYVLPACDRWSVEDDPRGREVVKDLDAQLRNEGFPPDSNPDC